MFWDELGYINASTYRKKIILALAKKPQTPKQLSDGINIKISHVSRGLKELVDKELVICQTPDLKRGKIYSLTAKSKSLLKSLKE